jgi:hypothetical protein
MRAGITSKESSQTFHRKIKGRIILVSLHGVVVNLSGLRDRGPGFKTRSRPLTFTKATLISEPYMLWGSHALTNSSEFRHAKDVKTLELRVMN